MMSIAKSLELIGKFEVYIWSSYTLYYNDSYGCVMEYNRTQISSKIETDHERTSVASALVSRDFGRNLNVALFHNAFIAIIMKYTA